MTTFAYKARNEEGKAVTGTIEAASEEDLLQRLKKMSYMPVSVQESSKETQGDESGFGNIEIFTKKIKTEDLVVFNMQLSSMIDAGITLLSALNIIGKQVLNPRFKKIIETMAQSVSEGSSFSDALKQHPKVFSHLYINMVRAGETGGSLNVVLGRLATYMENQEDLRQQVKGALFYPLILMIAGFAVVLMIVTFVIPKFIVIFDKSGVPLPLPTQILYSIGMAVKKFWYLFLVGGFGVFYGVKTYISTPKGKYQFDRFCLKIPVVGPLIRKVVVSRFSRTMATLVESGVPMMQSLDIMKDVVSNEVFSRVIVTVRQSVERGERLDQPLRMSGEFPADAVHMISVGEETGKIGYMLTKIADFYDTTIGYAIKKLTSLIEPVFIIIIGMVVALIMASMLIPIFDMVKTIQR